MTKMRRAFDTEREGLREWVRYAVCLLNNHRVVNDGDEFYCSRCGDVLPEEKERAHA